MNGEQELVPLTEQEERKRALARAAMECYKQEASQQQFYKDIAVQNGDVAGAAHHQWLKDLATYKALKEWEAAGRPE